MDTKQLLGLVGTIMLVIGVFAPIINIPFVGMINYFQNGKGDGVVVLVLAAICFILVLVKQYKWLWLPAVSSLGVILFTFINFHLKMSQMRTEMELEFVDSPFRGLADLAIHSIKFQWGMALLIIGVGLVIASAYIAGRNSISTTITQNKKND